MCGERERLVIDLCNRSALRSATERESKLCVASRLRRERAGHQKREKEQPTHGLLHTNTRIVFNLTLLDVQPHHCHLHQPAFSYITTAPYSKRTSRQSTSSFAEQPFASPATAALHKITFRVSHATQPRTRSTISNRPLRSAGLFSGQ